MLVAKSGSRGSSCDNGWDYAAFIYYVDSKVLFPVFTYHQMDSLILISNISHLCTPPPLLPSPGVWWKIIRKTSSDFHLILGGFYEGAIGVTYLGVKVMPNASGLGFVCHLGGKGYLLYSNITMIRIQ